MGERVNTLKLAQLYAEVQAFDVQKDRAEMAEKAIGNGMVANFAKRGNGGRIEKRRGFQKWNHGSDAQHWDGFDKRNFCKYCKKNGHLIDECFKLLWKKQIVEDEDGKEDNYKPAFTGASLFGKH